MCSDGVCKGWWRCVGMVGVCRDGGGVCRDCGGV